MIKPIFTRINKWYRTCPFKIFPSNETIEALITRNMYEDRCDVINNIVLHVKNLDVQAQVTVTYNDTVIFDVPYKIIDSITTALPCYGTSNSINLSKMIFHNQFIPMGRIKVTITHNKCIEAELDFESYKLCPDESRRIMLDRELFYYGWFYNSPENSKYLKQPTNAYISRVIYTPDGKMCSRILRRPTGTFSVYESAPDITENELSLTSWQLASLIDPGIVLVEQEPTVIIVQYVALMQISDEQLYAYHHLYDPDPIITVRNSITERLIRYINGEKINVEPIGDGRVHHMVEGPDYIKVVNGFNAPRMDKYPIIEPDWKALVLGKVSNTVSKLDAIINECKKNTITIHINGNGIGNEILCWCKNDLPGLIYYFKAGGKTYQIQEAYVAMFIENMVPINDELKEAIESMYLKLEENMLSATKVSTKC